MDRRKFLKTGGIIVVGATSAYGLRELAAAGATLAKASGESEAAAGVKWGMVIDLDKCQADCHVCMEACRRENNTAFHNDKRYDIHWIRKVTIRSKDTPGGREQSVPLLCNQCDDPPCAMVCPVQATYKRHDGIVLIDHHRCIGCRYCVVACPYNARYFNYKHSHDWPNTKYPKRTHGVAESCNFCSHLLDDGHLPACVNACPRGALVMGDLNDPESRVSQLIARRAVKRLRDDLGTKPKVYYVGLRTG